MLYGICHEDLYIVFTNSMECVLASRHRDWYVIIWFSLMLLAILGVISVSNMKGSAIFSVTKFMKRNPAAIKYTDIKRKLSNALDKASENKKIILLWHLPHDQKSGIEDFFGWSCGSCTLTSNTSKIDNPKTASVVFLYRYARPEYMPKQSKRRADQLYVYRTGESPSNLLIYRQYKFEFADKYKFNATMSYRRDSDIYYPYSAALSKRFIETNLTKIMELKSRFSIALVSNCESLPGSRMRLQYLKQLQLKLPLDGFGKCFEKPVEKTKNKTALLQMLRKYKFYFAFENSYHCRDYITEKLFFNGIRGSTLPVVMGPSRKDYEAIVPPDSFIHIEDFSSMDQLVEYLKYLDGNDTAYLQYFRWRTTLGNSDYFSKQRARAFCQLCRIINGINVDDVYHPNYNSSSPPRPLFTESISNRTVHSLSSWIKNDNKECLSEEYTLSSAGNVVPMM